MERSECNNHSLIQEVKEFVNKSLVPIADDLDRDNCFPQELLPELQAIGAFGWHYPRQYGGRGIDSLTAHLAAMELAKASAGVALTIHVHWMAIDVLLKYGTEKQKVQFLPDLLGGKKLAAYIISEAQAGSDAAAIKSTAIAVTEGWILNGSKYFCTNGGLADIYVVALKTDPSAGPKGISLFIVEKGTPGFKIGLPEEKMGCRSSFTTGINFRDCLIPNDNLLGEVNDGFRAAMYGLVGGRLGMASMGLGISEAAMEAAVKYAKKRIAFGKPLSTLYAVQAMVADMYIKIEAAKLMLYETARKRDRGEDYAVDSSVVKIFVSDTANEVCHKALQIFGGHGYMKHNPIERYYRDARLMDVGVGASEVLKMVVGSSLLK